jgi:hypothetical protein
METVSLGVLLDVLKNFGPIGLIAIMWWVDNRNIKKIIDENRHHNDNVLDGYKRDMLEIRRMYENNVHLVQCYVDLTKDYKSLTADLKDAYILNTQAFQRLSDDVEGNEFCPHVRLQKKASGVVG